MEGFVILLVIIGSYFLIGVLLGFLMSWLGEEFPFGGFDAWKPSEWLFYWPVMLFILMFTWGMLGATRAVDKLEAPFRRVELAYNKLFPWRED